jgi:hypothetical protein
MTACMLSGVGLDGAELHKYAQSSCKGMQCEAAAAVMTRPFFCIYCDPPLLGYVQVAALSKVVSH